jgi:protein SCO1/2
MRTLDYSLIPTGIFVRYPLVMGCIVALLLSACGKEPKFTAAVFDPPEPAPALVLRRADGTPFDLRQQKGSVVLLFFGYTHCPDVCPTTLAEWKRVKPQLGDDTARVKFVFVSVDPDRDTPKVAEDYAKNFDPSFIGLSGDSARIADLKTLFRVFSFQDIPPEMLADTTGTVQFGENYTVTHTSQTFVIDPEGKLRLIFQYGTPADAIAKDVKTLLKE